MVGGLTGAVCWLSLSITCRRTETTEKRVAITFDDGPNPPYTERVLEILARAHVRATFFLIGRNIELHRTTALKIVAAGHEIGNHSYWHRHLRFEQPSLIREEVESTDHLIKDLGYRGPIPFRAPFGENLGTLGLTLRWLDRPNILYDVGPVPPDYLHGDPVRIFESTLARVRPGSVILFHDGEGIRTETVIAAEDTLRALLARGYRFETVSELFGSQGIFAPPAHQP